MSARRAGRSFNRGRRLAFRCPAEEAALPSRAYALFSRAMLTQKQVLCVYDGFARELCPIILGHSKGRETALTYQFAGQSRSGLPADGEWRCLLLDKISKVRLRDGPLRSGDAHRRPQGCVEIVDLDVNADSPYDPARGH